MLPSQRPRAGANPRGSSLPDLTRVAYFYPIPVSSFTISLVSTATTRIDRVLAQLRLYEHPLLEFSARAKGEAVEVLIEFRNPPVPVHTYIFEMHPRDLDHPQFEWTFQRQLYDCLHDYMIEMFIRTPQDRALRQREGL